LAELVRFEINGAVGDILLDRSWVNAINRDIHRDLLAVAEQVAGDPDIRAVVLYGGERAFAAGADIKEMVGLTPHEITSLGRTLNAAVTAVARLTHPVIAAITGYALGGGFELALAADFRLVADNAKVGLPEISLGVIPGAGGTQRLARLIGPTKAKELIFTGRPIGADEAVALGIASRALPADQVFTEALAMASRLAAGPTAALAAAKRAIDDGLDGPLSAGLEIEAEKFAELFGTEDARTGMTSFIEQGPGKATFVGR